MRSYGNTFFKIIFALLSLCSFGSPAFALISIAWVAGNGSDILTCGAATLPCRTFQYVHDNIIFPNGSIYVIRPGDFGPLQITKPISIINDSGGVASVLQSTVGQSAITINVGPTDNVLLRGLTLDGLEVGDSGIVVNSGASVQILNCSIRRFDKHGIAIHSNSGTLKFTISDVLVANVPSLLTQATGFPGQQIGIGILVDITNTGSVNGIIKNSAVDNNATGMYFNGSNSPGAINLIVKDSSLNGNSQNAIHVMSNFNIANTIVLLDGLTATNTRPANVMTYLSEAAGLFATTRSIVRLRNSVFTNNFTGIFTNGYAIVESLGDNMIYGNETNLVLRNPILIVPN